MLYCFTSRDVRREYLEGAWSSGERDDLEGQYCVYEVERGDEGQVDTGFVVRELSPLSFVALPPSCRRMGQVDGAAVHGVTKSWT